MKKVFGVIILMVILLGATFHFITNKEIETKTRLRIKGEDEKAKIVSVMVGKYNAISDWANPFNGRFSFIDTTYTIEVQNALIKTYDRPVLFFSHLNDIVKEGEKYFLYFDNMFPDPEGKGVEIHLILECTPDQAEKIMVQSKRICDNHAVVARIKDVKKIRFDITNTAEDDSFSHFLKLEPSNGFIANGICLDFVFVGQFRGSDWREFLKREKK